MSKNCFRVRVPGDPRVAFDRVRRLLTEKGGSLNGDDDQGTISSGTIVGQIEIAYQRRGDELMVNVLRKPLLVSIDRIRSEVDRFFQN